MSDTFGNQGDSRRGGFTLLEVVLATALTAMLAAAGWTWVRGAIRAGDLLQHRLADLEEATAVARIMRDDFRSAQPRGGVVSQGENGMRMHTLSEIPNQSGSGWRDIVWEWSPTLGVVRTDGDTVCVVSRRLRCTWLTDDHTPPQWWVEILPQVATGVPVNPSPVQPISATPWRFALGLP